MYVCTNISCSLCGADELYAAMRHAAGDDAAFNVRAFECLGACDIAPMASVDGVYVGPLTIADVPRLLEEVRAGRSGAGREAAGHAPGCRPERQFQPVPRPSRQGAAGAMTEALLLKDIDEPGLNTLRRL